MIRKIKKTLMAIGVFLLVLLGFGIIVTVMIVGPIIAAVLTAIGVSIIIVGAMESDEQIEADIQKKDTR